MYVSNHAHKSKGRREERLSIVQDDIVEEVCYTIIYINRRVEDRLHTFLDMKREEACYLTESEVEHVPGKGSVAAVEHMPHFLGCYGAAPSTHLQHKICSFCHDRRPGGVSFTS
ncbi:hypothetical protein RRG08_024204 [Elysia crispata]|uniref:Uncharacterized protein n=1 Tax=Elysia crispata TaxID=231223 RepID=A0AAE1D2I8_9GAST|nr:hypothetical protein RRG08_024204 [Elysia crispata]